MATGRGGWRAGARVNLGGQRALEGSLLRAGGARAGR
jgi:hypothetical protein